MHPFDELVKAEFNEAYYRMRARRFAAWDLYLRCLAAVLATSTVVIWGSQATGWLEVAWKTLSALAAVASALSPILRLSDIARGLSDLAAQWSAVAGEFRYLDEVGEEGDRRRYLSAFERASQLQAADTQPRAERLAAQVQKAILRQHADRFAAAA